MDKTRSLSDQNKPLEISRAAYRFIADDFTDDEKTREITRERIALIKDNIAAGLDNG